QIQAHFGGRTSSPYPSLIISRPISFGTHLAVHHPAGTDQQYQDEKVQRVLPPEPSGETLGRISWYRGVTRIFLHKAAAGIGGNKPLGKQYAHNDCREDNRGKPLQRKPPRLAEALQ